MLSLEQRRERDVLRQRVREIEAPAKKAAKRDRKRLKPTRGRVLDKSHKGAVARLFCVVTAVRTGREVYGVQVAHVRFSLASAEVVNPGKQRKPDDWRVLPLLPAVHHEQHARGDEEAFWEGVGIEPYALCRDLKAASPDHEAMLAVLRRYVNQARGVR